MYRNYHCTVGTVHDINCKRQAWQRLLKTRALLLWTRTVLVCGKATLFPFFGARGVVCRVP